MGIEISNSGAPSPRQEQKDEQRRERVADAPRGDFFSFMDRLDVPNVSPEIEPYLKKVRSVVENSLDNVTVRQVERAPNAWVFHRNDPEGIAVVYGIYFVGQSDLPAPELPPVSARLESLRKRIKEMFGDRRNNIVQLVIVQTGYTGDMERYEQMARSIVTSLKVETVPAVRSTSIIDLGGPVFEVDYSEDRVRAAVRRWSPHGVMPRIETGISITAKPRREDDRDRRDRDNDPEDYDFTADRSFVSIGGFLEVGNFIPDENNRDTGGKYELRYNVTTIATRAPMPGIAAIALGVLAPLVANQRFGMRQFARFGKNDPNLGMVMEDITAKGGLLQLENERELSAFYDKWFHRPDVVLNYQWGHEQIPGLWRMVSGDTGERSRNFIAMLAEFLNVEEPDSRTLRMAARWGTRIDGYYGNTEGQLRDSRDFDYFTLAQSMGVNVLDDARRDIMTTVTEDRRWTRDRQRLTAELAPGFTPMFETVLSGMNPDFIRWINESARKNIDIIDRNEARAYGNGRMQRRTSNFGDPRDMGTMVNSDEGPKYRSRDLLDD